MLNFDKKQERCDNIRYKVTAEFPILPRENSEKFPISYLKNTEFFLKTLYVQQYTRQRQKVNLTMH